MKKTELLTDLRTYFEISVKNIHLLQTNDRSENSDVEKVQPYCLKNKLETEVIT